METTKQDQRMYCRGYRYRLDSPGIASLYAKYLHDIGPLMRQWPDHKFTVARMETMETTKQAAQRIGIPQHTLYRRLQRLCDSGKVVIRPEDYVSGCLYLPESTWNEVCSLTPPPGRPRKGLLSPTPRDAR